MPFSSLKTRCAFTTPFHPYQNWRYIFCGTFPRVTPAGRYPAPHFYRARTFLFKKATTLLSDKIKI